MPPREAFIDAQIASLFFHLPPELRLKIYDQIFASTRFSFGTRLIGEDTFMKIVPARHGLALLQTCRRIKYEIGDRWYGQILLSFELPSTMLDTLSALPCSILQLIRRVRVRDIDIGVYFNGVPIFMIVMPDLLRLIPGLRLDELTLLGWFSQGSVYAEIEAHIRNGSGWKIMRYITYNTSCLWCPEGDYVTKREPQPGHWQEVLDQRDGAASKPTVNIFLHNEAGHERSIFDAPPCRTYPHDSACTYEEIDKEVMVVVERGAGVDISKGSSGGLPFSEGFFAEEGSDGGVEEVQVTTWRRLRQICAANPRWTLGGDVDEYYGTIPKYSEENTVTMEDSYVSVHDYDWTHLHHVHNQTANPPPLEAL